MSILLNIGNISSSSLVNGPGNRFVIWVQGCSLMCPGCRNKEFLPQEPKHLIDIQKLADLIIKTTDIEGVTYSGGEPFDQAEALYHLSIVLKEHGLSIVSYSGYTYNELRGKNDKYVNLLLSQLDILIDGRYEKDNPKTLLWRGSSNQKVYFFNNRYASYNDLVDKETSQIELSVSEEKGYLTGIFSDNLMNKVKKGLQVYGINLDVGV
ncbi:MAG: 4Fe-4S single cluster domain-containing protein [bacterium]